MLHFCYKRYSRVDFSNYVSKENAEITRKL